MGCHYQTCVITNLPIRGGDEVAFIPLVRTGDIQNVGYYSSTALWEPLSTPIFGKYDDYGGLESVMPGPGLDYFMGLVAMNAPDAFTPDEDEFNDIVDLIRDGNLSMGDEQVGFVMVHANAYYEFSKRDYSYYQTPEDMKPFDPAEAEKELEEFRQEIRSTYTKMRDMEATNPGFISRFFLSSLVSKLKPNNSLSSLFSPSSEDANLARIEILKAAIVPAGLKEDLLVDLRDLMRFSRSMALMRKIWTPQSGLGSQLEAYHMHSKLAEIVTSKIAENFDAKNDLENTAPGPAP